MQWAIEHTQTAHPKLLFTEKKFGVKKRYRLSENTGCQTDKLNRQLLYMTCSEIESLGLKKFTQDASLKELLLINFVLTLPTSFSMCQLCQWLLTKLHQIQ